MGLGLNVEDPVRYLMKICLQLAAAETYTPAPVWFQQPLYLLGLWVDAVLDLQKKKPKTR